MLGATRTSWMLVLVLAACSGAPARSTPPPSEAPPPIDAAIDAAPPDADVQVSLSLGAQLYEVKACLPCHSLDGTTKIGPSLRGYWGSTVELADGTSVVVDEAYVRESIVAPAAKLRAGFPASMPAYEGVLEPDELDALVAYIRSLR